MKKIILTTFLTISLLAVPAAMTASRPSPVTVEERVSEGQPSIKIDRSNIEFHAGDQTNVKFEIFSITGQQIKTVTVKSAPVKLDLPKGFYIIKCEYWTKRIMLK